MRTFWDFLAEAAHARKGIAFKAKALDDMEHAVLAQRLAQMLPAKSADYNDFLRRSVRTQGDILGEMKWEEWEVAKVALELGGVNPEIITDPRTTPAERHALIGKIKWDAVTVPKLKEELGASFQVPDDWKRPFGIAKLKKIKVAVDDDLSLERGEKKLLGIWRTLEGQLGDQQTMAQTIAGAAPCSGGS